jgi:hypothetical protein
MAFGVILWVVAFWSMGTLTLIGHGELLRWFALFAFAGNLVPYRYSGRELGMEQGEWFFFNLLAIGPFLFTLALGINMFFHGPEQLYVVPHAEGMDVHQYWLVNGELPPKFAVESDAERRIRPGDHMLGIAPGAFGYDVITRWARIELAEGSPAH